MFRPEHLLREARRQRGVPNRDVPELCVLDSDGDLTRFMLGRGARRSEGWACNHTELREFARADGTMDGIVGNAVGAPFAVLVAEQLFASGYRCLLSITSSGRTADLGAPPYVVLIDRALQDEGTSVHYLLIGACGFVEAPDLTLLALVAVQLEAAFPPGSGVAVHRGATWTTDAPYRETETAIAAARDLGVLAVEMEAAALYAFGALRGVPVTCVAHVTNTMGQHGCNDFENGEANGSLTALRIIEAVLHVWTSGNRGGGLGPP